MYHNAKEMDIYRILFGTWDEKLRNVARYIFGNSYFCVTLIYNFTGFIGSYHGSLVVKKQVLCSGSLIILGIEVR